MTNVKTEERPKYGLPVDSVEARRLNDAEYLFNTLSGGPIWAPLTVSTDKVTAVLDAPTGTGVWLASVGKDVPNAELWGIDRNPTMFPIHNEVEDGRKRILEVHDMLDPLPEKYHGRFDIICVRHLLFWLPVSQHRIIFENLLPGLKPGGFVQVLEHSWDIERYPEYLYKSVAMLTEALRLHHAGSPPAHKDVPEMLEQLGYINVKAGFKPMRFGAQEPDERLRQIADAHVSMGYSFPKVAKLHELAAPNKTIHYFGRTFEIPQSDTEWDEHVTRSKAELTKHGMIHQIILISAQRPVQ